MDLNNKELIVIGDIGKAPTLIFWFHGYGSNNWSFEPTMKMINMYLDDNFCIIMPNAPIVEGKRSWYPLPTSDSSGKIVEDYEGLESSKKSISDFISDFKIDNDKKIIIGGFSQGAALSLSMLFSTDLKIDGCIALSGYMPSAEHYKEVEIKNTKIFIAHGYSDQAISFDDYKKTYEFLSNKTSNIVSYTNDFGHTITKEVYDKIIKWLDE